MMNLHVNLILDSELRSSSRISHKFIIKVAGAVAGLLLLLLVAVVLVGAGGAKSSFLYAEQEKKQLDPAFRLVTDLKQELATLQDVTNAVAVWSCTRPDWPVILRGIQAEVPPRIQLTRLAMNETISIIDAVPTRVVTLYIQGKAAGTRSETDVQEFEKSLKSEAPFLGVMDTAQVKQFVAVNKVGQENMRVFDIECRFKASKLFVPKPRPKDGK